MAQVNQQTGEDWDNVSLILSTARPSEGANPPVLAAWYLNTYDQSRFRGGLQDIIVTAEKKDIDKYITAQVPMEQAASQYSSAEVVQTAISTSFALEKKETIPSNKEFKKVPVKAVSFMAETENYIVPRL